MESVNNLTQLVGLNHAVREKGRNEWLKNSCGFSNMECAPLAADASFRRYFRIQQSGDSYVLMDAPPPERCAPFVAIANALRSRGLLTPVIFQADLEKGFLLLSDFGDTTYLKALRDENADQLYTGALDALAVLQGLREVAGHTVPPFTGDFMRQEWDWHKEWFLRKLLGLDVSPAPDEEFELLVASAVRQPQVFMHRDYHSANLMVVPERGPGILDFQDAFIGPVTYDLVSVLRDCYIGWREVRVETWARYYWQLLSRQGVLAVDQDEFMQWFDWMGLERHLKALFTFARKKIRDNHPQYLRHVPRVLNYIVTISGKYPELSGLHDYYKNRVMPLCAP